MGPELSTWHREGASETRLREESQPASNYRPRSQIGLHLRAAEAGPSNPWKWVPSPGTAEGGVFPYVHGHGLWFCLQNRSIWRRERSGVERGPDTGSASYSKTVAG